MSTFTRILRYGKLFMVLFVLLFAVCGCGKKEVHDEHIEYDDFINRQEIGFVGYGGFLFKYTSGECQMSVNIKRKQLRMQNDTQTDYVHIAFNSFPDASLKSVGVVLRYKVGSDEITVPVEMEIAKREDGKVWLWNNTKGLGLVVPVLWQ